jgi:sugar/nucleoside kinase (ribokinase family)
VIVVIGSPVGLSIDDAVTAGGTASLVAFAAARAGRPVQLVGKIGDDVIADAIILDLGRGGVGHVALLRDAARATPCEKRPAVDDEADIGDDGPDRTVLTEDPPETAAPGLDAADVELGMRYLNDFAVVALAERASPETVAVVAEAARWSAARLIVVVGAGEPVPEDLPPDAIVFEAPEDDPDGVFAALVGVFAAALDDGTEPGEAFRASMASDGWTGASEA